MWQSKIAMLTQHYRVIVPDLWGRGQSDELPKNVCLFKIWLKDHL
ncbi:MAG TPA: hypothetical protein VGH95_04340 [Candidatus Aquirickettsiella sp.]|jgi:hypothetical protein